MWYGSVDWVFTLNEKHGFGILFDLKDREYFQQCFYADGTLLSGKSAVDFSSSIDQLERYASDSRWGPTLNATAQKEAEKLIENASYSFSPKRNYDFFVDLKTEKENIRISVVKKKDFYTTIEVNCSCGKRSCGHKRAAAIFMQRELNRLQHLYVTTDKPVDKSAFLEPELKKLTLGLDDIDIYNTKLTDDIKSIISLIRSANSEVYYWKYHEYLLNMQPHYEYDSKLIENRFAEILIALFEDPGYQKYVLESGTFADPQDYEGRQRRSNRTSLKRVLKDYQRIKKAMDEKGDFSEHTYKEFLLKYREDWKGLLRYYAENDIDIEDYDLPFLKLIAAEPELDASQAARVAKKLDEMTDINEATPVLRSLMERISPEQKVEIYSQMRHISMSAEEIHSLDKQDQLKMIRNTPLTKESFRYIMDELLADSDPASRGRFLLHAVEKVRPTKNVELKKAIADQAARMPDNKLLLFHTLYTLRDSYYFQLEKQKFIKDFTPNKGDPERELKTCFDAMMWKLWF